MEMETDGKYLGSDFLGEFFVKSTIKVSGIYNSEKVLKMLDSVFESKSMEYAFILHQLDGVGSQEEHLGSFRKLNGISVALVARLLNRQNPSSYEGVMIKTIFDTSRATSQGILASSPPSMSNSSSLRQMGAGIAGEGRGEWYGVVREAGKWRK
uniref:Uncharacterized protein n=1 Tax=Tanacetum cinerariifolium TaxID=118510 RepID=A0A6L2NMD8_TANCI|nr:hypothetical protein [Tanacetum cinerariifolium]